MWRNKSGGGQKFHFGKPVFAMRQGRPFSANAMKNKNAPVRKNRADALGGSLF
jgi:hypothetical protein